MPTKPSIIEILPRNPSCERCILHESTKHVCIPGIGPKNAEIVIVGEAPGSAEAKTGKPFQGPAGQLLRQVLSDEGIDPETVFITNMVGCRPPDNRTPTNPELRTCKPYLDFEIEEIKPRFVLLLGATALKYIKKTGITELRGSVFEIDGIQYFCTFHPAAILRDPGKESGFRADIAKFKRLTEGTIETDRKQGYKFVTPVSEDLFITKFRETQEFSFDIETTGLQQHAQGFRVNSIGYTLADNSTWVLPLALNKNKSWASTVFKHTTRLSRDKIAIAHNGKFDNMGLWHDFGCKYELTFDTMLASHLFDENSPHDLKYLARIFCGAPEWDDLMLREKIDPVQYNCLDKFYQYQAEDPYWTMQLYRYYRDKFKGTMRLRRLFNKLVMPVARIFEEIDYGGQFINLELFEKTRIELKKRIAQNEEELWAMCRKAGIRKRVNWGSPKQVGDVLFNKLGLPLIEKTPTGAPATGEATLLELQGLHPIGDKLIEWRGNNKQLNTYIEGWEELMEGPMLYLSTKLHGTVTGRYSSRLHQTPRDGTIRNLIDAPEPYTFICADFSQVELRLAAHAAQDPHMITIFNQDGDIHWKTALSTLGLGEVGIEIETAKMYCVQQGLFPDGESTEILRDVWSLNKGRKQSKTILQICREEREDTESRNGEWWRTTGGIKSMLERRVPNLAIQTPEEAVLRALQKYTIHLSASHKRKSHKLGSIQPSDALSLLSHIGPSIAQELDKRWKESRKAAKAIGFGYLYGMGAAKFQKYAKQKYGVIITAQESKDFRDQFFNLYPGLLPWHDRMRQVVREQGYVEYLSGRLRRLPGVFSRENEIRSECERQAINSPIQGFGSGDLKAMAIVGLHEELSSEDFILKGEVHDSVLAWVKTDKLGEILPKVKRIMENPPLLKHFKIELAVPLKVDIEYGTWGNGSEFKSS